MHRDENGRTRTKILVQKRSYLDGGTEVMPGDNSSTYRTDLHQQLLLPSDAGFGLERHHRAEPADPRSVLPAGQEQSVPGFMY